MSPSFRTGAAVNMLSLVEEHHQWLTEPLPGPLENPAAAASSKDRNARQVYQAEPKCPSKGCKAVHLRKKACNHVNLELAMQGVNGNL